MISRPYAAAKRTLSIADKLTDEYARIAAYQRGIFPWYSEGLPILWHCPDPRFVLESSKLHVPASLRKTMKKRPYEVKLDTAFEADASEGSLTPGHRARNQSPSIIVRLLRASRSTTSLSYDAQIHR